MLTEGILTPIPRTRTWERWRRTAEWRIFSLAKLLTRELETLYRRKPHLARQQSSTSTKDKINTSMRDLMMQASEGQC